MNDELIERLRAHAEAHEYIANADHEQKQWMHDLYDAADAIERLQTENTSFRAAMKACEDCGPNDPVWIDGEPANLEAAAADALEWLRFFLYRSGVLGHMKHIIDFKSGETTCSERPAYQGSMCRFVGSRHFGTQWLCTLFHDKPLNDESGWLQRLPECLATFGGHALRPKDEAADDELTAEIAALRKDLDDALLALRHLRACQQRSPIMYHDSEHGWWAAVEEADAVLARLDSGADPIKPFAWALTHRDGSVTLHLASEYATAYRDTCVKETPLYVHETDEGTVIRFVFE